MEQNDHGNIIVSVRIRSLDNGEKSYAIEQGSCKSSITLHKHNPKNNVETEKSFLFDFVHWSTPEKNDVEYASQSVIYRDIGRNIVDNVLHGYNACVLAFGQTGSGKTFTMFGDDDDIGELEGLIPRIW